MWILIARVNLLIEYLLNICRERRTLNTWEQGEKNVGVVDGIKMPAIHESVNVFNIELKELILWNVSLKEVVKEFVELIINSLHDLVVLS